ncbi:MAG: glycosyltransferase family 4 protein [Pseudomonadota bacterium]
MKHTAEHLQSLHEGQRVTVIQPGARLHYGLPQALAKAGLLRTLHTDLHGEHPVLRALSATLPTAMTPKPLRRLLGRRLPADLPKHRVKESAAATLFDTAASAVGMPGASRPRVTAAILKGVERAPLGPGDVVYTLLVNEDVEALERLKARGVRIVHEVLVNPDVATRLLAEHVRHDRPDGAPDPTITEKGRLRDKAKHALADLVIAPSTFTANAIKALSPGAPVTVVPYGLDRQRFAAEPCPQPGRILSVGTVGLLKGHPDLAAATRQLKRACPGSSVRVAGPFSQVWRDDPLFDGPTYLGQVPRRDILEEYRKADVFAFPTLCDSFGLVLVEAMFMGVPVVCTPHCGDVVRDGVDGFVVPAGDSDALFQRLREIVEDRALRAFLSENARQRARAFSLEAYGERLVSALAPLLAPMPSLKAPARAVPAAAVLVQT